MCGADRGAYHFKLQLTDRRQDERSTAIVVPLPESLYRSLCQQLVDALAERFVTGWIRVAYVRKFFRGEGGNAGEGNHVVAWVPRRCETGSQVVARYPNARTVDVAHR